jgi:hypothetical protein
MPSDPRARKVQFWCPDAFRDKLRAEAKRLRMTQSKLVMAAVDAYLETLKAHAPLPLFKRKDKAS